MSGGRLIVDALLAALGNLAVQRPSDLGAIMRFVGLFVALIVIVWVVGSLVLFIRGRHQRDQDHLPDPDVASRRRKITEEKQQRWNDQIPPW
jgi:hypothetical protein